MNERSIFIEALDRRPGTERTAYLDEACGPDAALRQRVEALLASHEGSGDFLGTPAPQRVAEALQAQGSTPTRSDPPGAGEETLDFLVPSEEPGRLGRLDHYEVHQVIGRGGMGIVLKAFDQTLHRFVAIKALAPELATSATARQRFVREARAAAAVRNEHVIDIHSVEEANTPPYLVMEYVSGLSLQERLDRTGPMELKTILRIGMQIAAGLAAAHAQGLVHRDVKPANILLENGVERVKITDFGLARAGDDCSLTHSGVVAGTPNYMAPEQAGGAALDHRADLFSLGSVLYALCTGGPPFRADGTLAVLRRVCEDTPRPLREINPEVPEWLADIVGQLHAKDPARRFQSAAEVAELLSQHLAHLQQPAVVPRPPTPARRERERPEARPRRRRWVMAAALLLLLGGLGLAEATGVTRIVPTVIHVFTADGTLVVESEDPAVKVTIEGDGGLLITGAGPHEVRLRPGPYRVLATRDGKLVKTELVTITRRGRSVVRISLEPLAQVRADPPFQFTPPPPGVLDRLDPARIPAEERFAWQPRELVQVLGDHRGKHWGEAYSVAFHPDGKMIASGAGDGIIRLWDAQTLREHAVFAGHRGGVCRVDFSPDGRFLLSAGADGTLRRWDVATRKQLRRLDVHTGTVSQAVHSADGRRALSCGEGDTSVCLWDLETGQQLRRCNGHTAKVYSVAFSPDGRRALSGSHDRTLRLWDLETGKELRCFREQKDIVRSVAFSPDGRLALSGGGNNDSAVRLWEVETGRELRAFVGHTHYVNSVAFSPDGRRALSSAGSFDGTSRLWDVDSGKELRRLEHGGSGGWYSVFAPDGRRAVAAAGPLRLWDLQTGKELCPRPGHPVQARGLAFSPDGRHLLSCSDADRTVRLWDIESGKEVRRLEGHTAPVHSVAFAPDGHSALSGGQDGAMRLWDLDSGKERLRCQGYEWFINSVAFSPDGRQALAGGSQGARLWDVESGRELRHFVDPDRRTWGAAFSSDGRRVLTGRQIDTVVISDVDSGEEVRRYKEPGTMNVGVIVAPDGRSAFSTGREGMLRRWDLDGAQPRHRTFFKWHTNQVYGLAVAPDGQTVASAGWDGRIILWEAATGIKLREWQLPGLAQGVAFAPDGRHLATANGNGTIYILRLAVPTPSK